MASLRRLNCKLAQNISKHHFSLMNVRTAAVPARESMEELHKSITNTLENMNEFASYNMKLEQLHELGNQLNNDRLHERESESLSNQYYNLQQQLSNWKELERNYKEYWEFYELALEDNDESLQKDCWKQLENISTDIDQLYYSLLLNGDDDHKGCYIQVSSGSGGIEAQDWAETLFEMYVSYAKRHKHQHKVLFKKTADIGINQAALEINAFNAYGWLRYEEGVHRRSRVSPYGQTAGQKRQTSFASVQVTAMSDGTSTNNSTDITDIADKSIEWEAFRGSGPGGQHRNTTDSAVRCIHKPTGITVVVQDERNQYGAKVAALRYLNFKLRQREEENMKQMKKDKHASFSDQTFGNQIRNYVYTPYQMIKDTRTKCEIKGHAMKDALDDGNIDILLRKSVEMFNRESDENDNENLL